ncbi:unnamed protein product [Ceutorhynchus assimilis]|uniref:Uncharacterized protein n=1 Tax=Ceutorhynchus assimilis TaxID=467358 RepID=A0A9N9QJN1_9CUCU|nr:unnamed protein product [Ceutorhynchus assimilis]
MCDQLLKFLSGEKNIRECSAEELKELPIDFFLKYVDSSTLLHIWGLLPVEHRQEFELQIKLPCFIHYNRPDWRTHVDGPPSSQKTCTFCIKAFAN